LYSIRLALPKPVTLHTLQHNYNVTLTSQSSTNMAHIISTSHSSHSQHRAEPSGARRSTLTQHLLSHSTHAAAPSRAKRGGPYIH
ncbi:MAG: hypothetical protein ACREOZ_04735, partial [Gloeomargaritales cyanobacterium]